MAMRSVAAASWRLTGNRIAGSAWLISDGKGKVLSEEELAVEKNKLFTQKLQTGDMFVFLKGLIHYQRNPDAKMNAVAVAAFGSTNAGTISILSSDFTTGIDVNVLAKASSRRAEDRGRTYTQNLRERFSKLMQGLHTNLNFKVQTTMVK